MKASTGNKQYDKEAAGEHEAVLDDGTVVTVAGEIQHYKIFVDGRSYVHVSEDDKGRWVYGPA